ncbi:hypothetical protein E4H04_10295 [Candidatus Bathyarchaeota archaeon]|nr:MAG: hypothetical protein E4H04_10295 [Candidatus Bathyarchaeota archaeon]
MNKFMKIGLVAMLFLSSATVFTYAKQPATLNLPDLVQSILDAVLLHDSDIKAEISDLDSDVADLASDVQALQDSVDDLEGSEIQMETREGVLSCASDSIRETITYDEIRHVSLTIQARNLFDGDSFYLLIQMPGDVGSLVILDDEFHHLEFETVEWIICASHYGGENTIKVVYYTTETYIA